MGIKVHVQFMSPEGKYDKMYGVAKSVVHNGILQLVRDSIGADAHVSGGYNNHSVYYTTRAFMSVYNNVGILEGLIQGQQDGADVALIACGNDPALREAREALDIPVVGITESAMRLAGFLGKRFAVVGIECDCADLVASNLEFYGLQNLAIQRDPIRTADLAESLIPWFESPELVRNHVIPRFEEAARGAIADGAEVIVTSCAGLAVLSLNGYSKISGTEVPVVEGVLAGAQMAQVLGTLRSRYGVSTSKQGIYKGLPKETVDHCLAPLRERLAAA